jgi:hypothetical protein
MTYETKVRISSTLLISAIVAMAGFIAWFVQHQVNTQDRMTAAYIRHVDASTAALASVQCDIEQLQVTQLEHDRSMNEKFDKAYDEMESFKP